jgi:hypothetical protein
VRWSSLAMMMGVLWVKPAARMVLASSGPSGRRHAKVQENHVEFIIAEMVLGVGALRENQSVEADGKQNFAD